MAKESNLVEVPISEETYALLEEIVAEEHAKGNTEATVDSVATDLIRSWLLKLDAEQGEIDEQKEESAEQASEIDCEGG